MLIFCALSVHYGLGRPILTLTLPQRSMSARMLTARAEAWSWGTTLLKLSIATMIVRIKGEKNKWRWPLYGFCAFLVALALTSSAWNYTTCIPLEAAWDFDYPRTKCRPQATNVLYLLIGGSKSKPFFYSSWKCQLTQFSHIYNHRFGIRSAPLVLHLEDQPASP